MSENGSPERHRRLWRSERAAAGPYLVAALIVVAVLAIVFLLQPVYFLALAFVLGGILIIAVGRANPYSLPAGVLVMIVGAILVVAALANPGVGLSIGGFQQAQGI